MGGLRLRRLMRQAGIKEVAATQAYAESLEARDCGRWQQAQFQREVAVALFAQAEVARSEVDRRRAGRRSFGAAR